MYLLNSRIYFALKYVIAFGQSLNQFHEKDDEKKSILAYKQTKFLSNLLFFISIYFFFLQMHDCKCLNDCMLPT